MTFDGVVSVVGTVAAIVVAVYAVRAFRSFQGARARDLKPRPRFTFLDPVGPSGLRVTAVNAGGAVVQGFVVVRGRGPLRELPVHV